jgi:hypothetical protein
MLASASGNGGTLVSRSDISLAGNVGHEVKVEFPDFYVIMKLYSVGQRVYQVTAAFKKDAQSQESALKVLDSLDITVYGYLDGNRVSHVGTVYYEHDIAVAIPFGDAAAARSKFDPRYSYRYAYKYDDKGRLTEEDRYLSNGELAERYVRVYSGNQMQRLTYLAGDSLSKKSVETLDAQGRSVDEADYDVKTGAVKEKYSRTYDSFDARGNWTKLTTYKWAEKDGKGQFVSDHVTYRTITYY